MGLAPLIADRWRSCAGERRLCGQKSWIMVHDDRRELPSCSLRTVAAGHAFVQNLRRGHYELATDRSPAIVYASHSANVTTRH
jgi:hypothetical protein